MEGHVDVFKILSKVLANRLLPLVGAQQTGFVAGRNIFEGVVDVPGRDIYESRGNFFMAISQKCHTYMGQPRKKELVGS